MKIEKLDSDIMMRGPHNKLPHVHFLHRELYHTMVNEVGRAPAMDMWEYIPTEDMWQYMDKYSNEN